MAMHMPSGRLQEIPAGSGVAFNLNAGATLRVVDPYGGQVADLVAFDGSDPREALSNGRSFDYAGTLRLTTGHELFSNRSRPLLKILRDDVGVHDFLITPCECAANLAAALSPYGIGENDIPTSFKLFMNVEVAKDGALRLLRPRSAPGDAVELRALSSLIVGLTACTAPYANKERPKPIRFTVLDPG